MSSLVQFRRRTANPNIGPGTPISIPTADYLVASLKGGAGLSLQSTQNLVWLTGEFNVLADVVNGNGGVELTVSIFRAIGSASLALIYGKTVYSFSGGDTSGGQTITVNHVDQPGALGPVNYFLYVRAEIAEVSSLILPVTFTGAQICP